MTQIKINKAKEYLRELDHIKQTLDGDERRELYKLWVKMQEIDIDIKNWSEMTEYLRSTKKDDPIYTPRGNRIARKDMRDGLECKIREGSGYCVIF